MAHSLSAKKRIRQNITRRARNRTQKSALKSQVRKYVDAVREGDVEAAREQLSKTVKLIDQTAAKGTIHKNAAGRKKSRLAKRLNTLVEPSG